MGKAPQKENTFLLLGTSLSMKNISGACPEIFFDYSYNKDKHLKGLMVCKFLWMGPVVEIMRRI